MTTLTETTTRTFTLSITALALMHDRIAEFNALAAKHGIDASVAAEFALHTVHRTSEYGVEYDEEMADVVLTGTTLVLPGGWALAAVLDLGEAGNIFRTNPHFTGPALPEEFRLTDGTRCDHCNVKRTRKTSIVVWNADDGFKVVGSDCVRLFLGVDPGWVVRLEKDLAGLSDPDNVRLSTDVSTRHFVATAALVTTVLGFVPRSADAGTPTSMIARSMVYGGKAFAKDYPELVDCDPALAKRASVLAVEAFEWIEANTETSEYITNLRLAARRDEVGDNWGLLASLPNAYRRAVAADAERKVRAARPERNEFIGAVGDKVEVTGSVVYTNRGEAYAYNGPESLFAIIVTDAGETVYVSTTVATKIGEVLEGAGKDEVLRLKGTVKDTRTVKGDKRVTVLTRTAVAK